MPSAACRSSSTKYISVRAISSNNKIPAIVDHGADGGPLSIFESGAILIYLAEKSGKLLPRDEARRWDVMQWLFWQVGGLGPMAGQLGHFLNYLDEKIDYPIERYRAEYNRLLGVLNNRLADREFIAGEYSIADIATWPWVRSHERLDQPLDIFPHVANWFSTIAERPAVKQGFELGMEWYDPKAANKGTRNKNLFGQTAKSVGELAKQKEKKVPGLFISDGK